MIAPFLAVDWGTTNRRVYLIEDGCVVREERSHHGASVLTAADYPREIANIRARFGVQTMLLAGMVGSTIGWCNVPYVAAPAGLVDLAVQLRSVAEHVRIVPGLSFQDDLRADVMRGEEVQLLGAAAAGLVPSDALLCQPGTHCKWAVLEGGRIIRFTTAMTGELFALIRRDGLLAPQLTGIITDGLAFRDGVVAGSRRDLAASLFGIRADSVLGLRDDADAAAYASGLVIGSDVSARLAEADGATVYVLADAALATLYSAAIDVLGGRSTTVDSRTAFVAGITRLQELSA